MRDKSVDVVITVAVWWTYVEPSVLSSVGLPSVCLSVPAVQEQKVCTASVDRQTHHNSLVLSQLMSRGEGRTE